jgi:chromosome segregation ATPase
VVDLGTWQQLHEDEPQPQESRGAAIETGVDRLIKLLHREKHLDLDVAAKDLGVPVEVVQDWASFLEDQQLAKLQYTLTKTFLVETPLSKQDATRLGNEYANKRDAFVRKVGSMLLDAEEEIKQLGDLKQEYNEFLELSSHIDTVREDMELLKHFEELKRNVDDDIRSQQSEHDHAIEQWHGRIASEEQRYNSILAAISDETKALNDKRAELEDIQKDENDVMTRVKALQDLMHQTVSRIVAESGDIKAHEERIKEMLDVAQRLREDMQKERKRGLEPMIQISKDQEDRISRLRESITVRIKEYFKTMQLDEDSAERTMRQLQQFFSTQARTANLISEIDHTESDIKQELTELVQKAKAVDMAMLEGGGATESLKQLEEAYTQLTQKKQRMVSELNQIRQTHPA